MNAGQKYEGIDESLELEIRRGYSARIKNMEALEKWIGDAIGQIVLHDPYLYGYKTRIKTIESVLNKISGKILDEEKKNTSQKWRAIKSFADAEKQIEDWVGCRVMTFLDNKVHEFHETITSNKIFKIEKITIHDHEDKKHRQFRGFKKAKDGRELGKKECHEIKRNSNGYYGVHYIINPMTIDPCWKEEPKIFPRFELQTRTLLQEAWGDVQHKLVYKGKRMPEDAKYAEIRDENIRIHFAKLAESLALCDGHMADLVRYAAQ